MSPDRLICASGCFGCRYLSGCAENSHQADAHPWIAGVRKGVTERSHRTGTVGRVVSAMCEEQTRIVNGIQCSERDDIG